VIATQERGNLVRVLIVDDFQPWRRFARSALECDPEYKVVGFASDGLTAISRCKRLGPDLLLLDINLPGCDGITAAQEIRRVLPDVSIVFFSQSASVEYVEAALELGARGFIAKRDIHELLRGVKSIVNGARYLSEKLRNMHSTIRNR